MILLYRVLSVLFYPILIVLIFVRKFLKKEHPTRYKEKMLSSNFNIQRKKKHDTNEHIRVMYKWTTTTIKKKKEKKKYIV